MERTSSRDDLDRKAVEQARLWMDKLVVQIDGKPVRPTFEDASLAIVDGAGNLPIVRITSRMRVAANSGRLQYEDHNFVGRAGWKEIVIAAGAGVRLESASQTDRDRSQALTAYPPDPMVAPPQDLRAEFTWTADSPIATPITTAVLPAPHSGLAKHATGRARNSGHSAACRTGRRTARRGAGKKCSGRDRG
jgi:hypothetical protein